MELTTSEKDSELWQKLSAHFAELREKDIKELSKRSTGLEPSHANSLRGRIALLTDFMECKFKTTSATRQVTDK